jgi:hypothetical protein
LFSVASPTTSTVLAGFVLGFLVALVAAVVAVATRRSEVVAPPAAASFGLPWSRTDDEDERPWQTTPTPGPTTTPSPWSSNDTERVGTSEPDQTAQLPAVDEQGRDEQGRDEQGRDEQGRDEQGREENGDATTQFPRHAGPPPGQPQ